MNTISVLAVVFNSSTIWSWSFSIMGTNSGKRTSSSAPCKKRGFNLIKHRKETGGPCHISDTTHSLSIRDISWELNALGSRETSMLSSEVIILSFMNWRNLRME